MTETVQTMALLSHKGDESTVGEGRLLWGKVVVAS